MVRFGREERFADGFETNKQNNRSREYDGQKKKTEAVGERTQGTEVSESKAEAKYQEPARGIETGAKRRRPAASKPDAGVDARAQVALVKKLLKRFEQKLNSEDVKASLGDFIRLMQLHKELDEETPREIRVTWVEPKGAEAEEAESEK